jgi:hypothetical protein
MQLSSVLIWNTDPKKLDSIREVRFTIMPSRSALSNKETWERVMQSFGRYPDTLHWNKWRSVIAPIIDQAIQAGYDELFRATTSMHDVLLFTSDYPWDSRNPVLRLSVTEDWKIQIRYLPGTYAKGAILASAIPSHTIPANEAFQILTRYLQHLWTETVPEPIPEVLRKGRPKEIR